MKHKLHKSTWYNGGTGMTIKYGRGNKYVAFPKEVQERLYEVNRLLVVTKKAEFKNGIIVGAFFGSAVTTMMAIIICFL